MTFPGSIRQSIHVALALGTLAVLNIHAQADDGVGAELNRNGKDRAVAKVDDAVINIFNDDQVSLQNPANRFSGSNPSDRQRMTAKELRQARAIHHRQQRLLRREHQLWLGYEPLRPHSTAIPMMSSRYGRPTIYVPVFVH